jgi:hypothetical protein
VVVLHSNRRTLRAMDTVHMIDYLVGGGLIKILDAGTCSRSTAFVARDDDSPSGFRIVFHLIEDENTSPLGKQVTPQNATNGSRILENKKAEVEDYLIESFGLNLMEARLVVNEARWVPLAA